MKKKSKAKTAKSKNKCVQCHGSSGIYGLGFIGALIYFIGSSTSFWMGVVGVLKSFIWPVFLVYELFKYLGL